MINICFAGVTGWTAPPILAAIDAADDLTLTSGVYPVGGRAGHAVYATAAEALAAAPADVLVDFTSAAAVRGNVRAAIEAGVHVVIGTSGLTADDYAEIDRLARDRGVGVIAAGNFSVMAAVLRRAATLAAEHLGHWEIIDYASDTKPDVPSGTRAASWPRPWARCASRVARCRSASSRARSRRAAPRSAGPGSTRSGCPASWSARRWCSAGRGSGWSCGTTRA